MVEPDAVGVGVVRRAIGTLRPVRSFGRTPAWSPRLPPGRALHLPGRGEMFVRDAHLGSAGHPPVLLLHGWTWSLDVNYFGLMPELVAAERPFVGIDHRGHAGGLPIRGELTLECCAEDVRCVLDSMSIDKVVVCGFSLGGPVGLHFALANPGRVAGFVLIATALNYTQTLRDRLLWLLLAAGTPLSRLGLGSTISARYFGASRRRGSDILQRWAWLRTELARTPVRNIIAMGKAVRRCDLRERVAPLRDLPSVIIVTTRDTLCRPALQYQLAQQIGGQVLPLDADHDVPVVDPRLFGDAVVEAIGRVDGSAQRKPSE